MARPRKSTTEKLSSWLPHVRCTPLDKERVEAAAKFAGMTTSDYVRHQAVNGQVVVEQTTRLDPDVMLELRRIGNNLNQLVRKFHETDVVPIELQRLYNKLQLVFDEHL